MNPVPQLRGPPVTSPPSVSTTNPGRFWFGLLRPYVTHAPRLGRPARTLPVFIWHTEPTWLRPSAQHERSTAMSSAHFAMCGSQSLISRPDFPYLRKVHLLASRLLPPVPIGVMTRPKLAGNGCP